MEFKEKPRTIRAFQLSEPVSANGVDLAAVGDWVVVSDDHHAIYTAEIFAERYESLLTDNPLLNPL